MRGRRVEMRFEVDEWTGDGRMRGWSGCWFGVWGVWVCFECLLVWDSDTKPLMY